MELLKLLSTNEIIAQLVCFFTVFFLLRKFAWRRLLQLIDDRKNMIAAEFKKIEDAKTEILQANKDYEAKLGTIEQATKTKIELAVAEGEKAANGIREKARQDAQSIIEHAKESIQSEIHKAKEELKTRIVDLTLSATERIIKEKVKADDRKLVEDFIDELDKVK